ncbi:monocarboxylate transporter 12-like [Elysia marginata]|uniref:Monocarboxylate transporter 12-like n=1 Tax=Elysia marginata TaxID=1093978 RepID=A0AAV4GDD7_9GAST|nr:monocarboxylate transporter 12-like [Elysia marginata]
MAARPHDNQYPPLDGGYGYVVVLSSTLVAFLNDGVGNSFGILMPHLLDDVSSNVAITSIAPGLRMAMFLFTDSSVGSGFAPWPRGRGFETQPSTVRAPTG